MMGELFFAFIFTLLGFILGRALAFSALVKGAANKGIHKDAVGRLHKADAKLAEADEKLTKAKAVMATAAKTQEQTVMLADATRMEVDIMNRALVIVAKRFSHKQSAAGLSAFAQHLRDQQNDDLREDCPDLVEPAKVVKAMGRGLMALAKEEHADRMNMWPPCAGDIREYARRKGWELALGPDVHQEANDLGPEGED